MIRSLRSLTCALGVLAGLAVPGVAQAAPTELFFSEYIEGSSNNKALEIYNGTVRPDTSRGGYSVQMCFNGSSVAGSDDHLVRHGGRRRCLCRRPGSSIATILAQADQTNGAGWFNGDDAVVLRKEGA